MTDKEYDKLLTTLLTLDDDTRNRLVKHLNAYLTIREKCAMMKDVRWNDHDGTKYYWEDDK